HHRPPDIPRPEGLHRAPASLRPVPGVRPLPLAAAAGLRHGQAAPGPGPSPPPGRRPPPTPMSETILAAALQMTSTADVERNLDEAERLVSAAAARGAALVGLPENFAFLRSEGVSVPEPPPLDGPWVRHLAGLARRHRITLLLGSLPERIEG